MLLSIEDRQVAMATLLRLAKKYEGRISALAGPLAEARHWNQMEEARSNGMPPSQMGGRLTGCGCPTSKLSVRADGVYTPCNLLGHMELGRINQDSLEDVWRESVGLNQLRARRTIPLTDFEFCAGCEYIQEKDLEPYVLLISRSLSTMISRASSQDMRFHFPSPLSPTRFRGYFRRSGW